MSAFLTPSVATSSIVYDRSRVCQLIGIPIPETAEPEIEPPLPGRFKMWVPNWNLIGILNRMSEIGLTVVESMHVRAKPFAKPTLTSGYLTMPICPPKCGNEKFRKPAQLKSDERLAPASALMMGILIRYLADLELLYAGHWLITADKCGNKTLCIQIGDGGIVLALHDDRRIQNADHACAVLS